jgi:hypothetical protein
MTLRDALGKIQLVRLQPEGSIAVQTAAREFVRLCAPGAAIGSSGGTPSLSIRVDQADGPAYALGVESTGDIHCSATHGSLLIALAQLAKEEWAGRPVAEFTPGAQHGVAFPWLRNLSDFLVGSLRRAKGFDREEYVRQIAGQGFTHVSINGLGTPGPFESGPPGDVYHWFYDYSPDLDQFVESRLLRGYYPAEYIASNLKFLRETAALAVRYGLTPGLHINSPRSMPEEFWRRYGYLRGARVDHPRETLLPRYTLAMAHPAVQEHYRELIRKILVEVPELGFIHVWTNDSGAGFEFVSSLYAGRNGGPYLIREWRNQTEIAKKAGENVLTYFHLLRDEARRVNPRFRLICDLGPFMDEREYVIGGMGNGIDAGDFAYFEGSATAADREGLQRVGAETHIKIEVSDNNVLGVPFPRLTHERLSRLREQGGSCVLTGGTPALLSPFDINREVVRAFQLTPERPLDDVLASWARTWGGQAHGSVLLDIWAISDRAVRGFPPGVPMSTFGFPWFRLWVRPFVPNIDAIPEPERKYYEDFLLATFNNPARIDLNNDMLWNFVTVREAGEKKRAIDSAVLVPLAEAVRRCAEIAGKPGTVPPVFADLHDRLRAARCFSRTMRNTLAWTESVHGYCEASSEAEKAASRGLCRVMVADELENARDLLDLWTTSRVHFMPVAASGETLHCYGENFGELLRRKIELMERFGEEEPSIDPDYMWRMHEPVPAH